MLAAGYASNLCRIFNEYFFDFSITAVQVVQISAWILAPSPNGEVNYCFLHIVTVFFISWFFMQIVLLSVLHKASKLMLWKSLFLTIGQISLIEKALFFNFFVSQIIVKH